MLEKKFFKEGLYLFNKPVGWTSFDVVNWVKRRAETSKVGHAGTLDPEAEGLLIIAVGRKFTSQINKIAEQEKEYIFEITFGIVTDTYDREGKIIRETKDFNLSKEEFLAVLESFKGKQTQIPPMYSAVKKNGRKLYELARQGQEIERQPREIEIRELELLNFSGKTATLRIVCSKGTYVRTLCYDIGEKLKIGAYMSKLIRTRIGAFKLNEQCLIPVSAGKQK